jgi:hypothetical protein
MSVKRQCRKEQWNASLADKTLYGLSSKEHSSHAVLFILVLFAGF